MAESNAPAQKAGEGEQTDKMQDYWKKELARAEKHFDTFWKKADKLYKLFAKQGQENDSKRKFAMLWANTEVMKPSIYARPPIPQVSRRYRDKDPVGRLAAEILERASGFEFERMNLDSVLRAVRDDLLLPGRGQAWVRYEAEIEGAEEEPYDGEEQLEAEMQAEQPQVPQAEPQVKEHKTIVDYVHYRQFLHSPARRWEEVSWVAKAVYMTDDEGKARFKDKWKGVPLDNKADSEGGKSDSTKDPKLENSQNAQATVFEIWCKTHKKVYFVAKGAPQVLETIDPYLDFEGFFPCPKPVYATVTNNSLIPTPDYKYYQDQAEEIDQLTARIGKLIDSLKLVGFYPAGAEGDVSAAMEKALSPGTDSQMIPIASWAAFGEKGGGNAIVWLPIREVVETIRSCTEVRNQAIQDVYQITGISDILRGSTDSNETATAQSIKAQWGSVRVRDRQQEMVRFARDLTRMVCEVISENYDPQYLISMTNIEMPTEPPPPPQQPPMQPPQPTGDPQQDQMAQQQMQQAAQQQQQAMQAHQQQVQEYQAQMKKVQDAFALLANDDMRGYRIEIETDSTIQPDEDAEKQRRTEFVTAVGGLLQQAVPLLGAAPELAPLVGETILFTARGFRAGRQLEDVIEQAFKAVQDRLSQPPPQQADPNAAMLEAKQKQAQIDIEHTTAKNQLDLQHKQEAHQLDLQIKGEQANHQLQTAQQTSELGLNTGKAKLRDQILAEEQDAFLGQPGEQVNGVAQVLQGTLGQLMEAMTNSNNQVLQSNQQLLTALTAPKVITAPDGRQYTAQTVN
jgi:hypothetical protein